MTVNKTQSTLDRNKQKKTHFPHRTYLLDSSHGRTLLFKHQRAWTDTWIREDGQEL